MICEQCKMLTEPMDGRCEFCGDYVTNLKKKMVKKAKNVIKKPLIT